MTEIVENSPPSLFCNLYKALPQKDQNKRREELLSIQKRRRELLQDECRGIDEPLEVLKFEYSDSKNKKTNEYSHILMLSEWFLDVPPDFDISWFMKVCPKGHRNLVVASQNTTKSFSKTGRFEYKFKSLLPGGGSQKRKNALCTILDCIWSEETNTFYILDVLFWGCQDLRNCDAEFRFYWLKNKISEQPELEMISSNNIYCFKYAPHYLCDHFSLKSNFEYFPFFKNNSPSVDGLLFYHKESIYTAGSTPLVGWLKPFMLPEILNINIPDEYFNDRPKNYLNLAEYIKKPKKEKIDNNVEMDES